MISNIQLLRAIAALMVVAFHAVRTSEQYSLPTDFFYKIDVWGAAGVDIFFVISGFIMVYIQHKKRRNPLGFIKDRVERIVPLYWFLTLSLAALLIIAPSAFNVREFNTNFLLSSLFFTNFISNTEPLIYVGWTLEYEMLFYLIFGSSLLIKNERLSLISTALALSVMVALGFDGIMLEFVYGMAIGYVFTRYNLDSNKTINLIAVVAGFILLTISWGWEVPRSIKWGLPATLIFLGFLFINPIKSNIFRKLGDASYSIYLVQVFSIPVFYKVINKLPINFPYMAEVYIVLCIAMTAIAGIMLYLAFEKPAIHVIKRIKSSNQSKVKNIQNI